MKQHRKAKRNTGTQLVVTPYKTAQKGKIINTGSQLVVIPYEAVQKGKTLVAKLLLPIKQHRKVKYQ